MKFWARITLEPSGKTGGGPCPNLTYSRTLTCLLHWQNHRKGSNYFILFLWDQVLHSLLNFDYYSLQNAYYTSKFLEQYFLYKLRKEAYSICPTFSLVISLWPSGTSASRQSKPLHPLPVFRDQDQCFSISASPLSHLYWRDAQTLQHALATLMSTFNISAIVKSYSMLCLALFFSLHPLIVIMACRLYLYKNVFVTNIKIFIYYVILDNERI